MPSLPSWLKAADPAQYYAEGLRIGDSEAAQSAESERAAAAGNRAEQELRMRQQELEARATQAAQKFQAQQGYQQAIQSGMDPTQAILKFGPAMGAAEDIPAALRAQQMAQRPQKQPFVPGPVKSFPVLDPQGKPIPNMLSVPNPSRTGMETRNLPGSDQPGYVSPQERLQAGQQAALEKAKALKAKQQAAMQTSLLTKQKLAKQKQVDDVLSMNTALQAQLGRAPTKAESDAYSKKLEKDIENIDEQLSKLAGIDAGGDQGGSSGEPKEGDVLKGHRFKGGDPAEKDNWEKVE